MPGVVKAARRFLSVLDLSAFSIEKEKQFRAKLDQTTERLRKALPRGAQHWGVARKVLNIFLRDALYTIYLREEYGLACVERFLEVPLDSITAKELKKAAGRGGLPQWPGVKGVAPDLSERFQAQATKVATERRMSRVHLDAYWWADRPDDDAP